MMNVHSDTICTNDCVSALSGKLIGAPRQVADHVLVVRLVCAPPDLQQLRIPPQALNVVLTHVAVAAHDLDGTVGHVLAHRAAVELHAVGVQAVAGGVQVEVAGRLVDVAAARLVLRVGLGDEALHLPEAVEVGAERLPLPRVLVHLLDASAGDPQAHGSQYDSLNLEIAHHAYAGAVQLADEIRSRDAAVVEDELGCHRGSHSKLILDLLSEGETLRALLDEEERHIAPSLAGLGVHEVEVPGRDAVEGAVGDPHLRAIQDVVVALAFC
mmetsp:Transcript_16858/g.47965  ORF Transcript_16858/g.47965 Transcript_16858/m.47965 type:complete len:270 (-) Transcript_16858:669-1478(-)